VSEASLNIALSLHAEATEILEVRRLRSTLEEYGRVVPHGSYALDLMVWRDLDLYLVPSSSIEGRTWFFVLGSRIANLLGAHRMHFRDETVVQTEGLPKGLYWGVHVPGLAGTAWKIDIWAVENRELNRLLEYQSWVAEKLSPDSRKMILQIKAVVHKHPEYRRSFGAKDIYEAVLNGRASNADEFWDHLRKAQVPRSGA